MSFFAGGSWRSTTGTTNYATMTNNTVLTPRQASVDESMSEDAVEQKPLLGAPADPLVGSQASISNPDSNPSRKRFTFRGVARAFYFMGSMVPAATATATTASSPPAHNERAVFASSPHSASTLLAPMKPSTLSRGVSPPLDNVSDHLGSPVSAGSGESTEDTDGGSAVCR